MEVSSTTSKSHSSGLSLFRLKAAAFRVHLEQPVDGFGLEPGGFGHALGGTARRGTQQQAHALSGEDAQDRVDDRRLAYPGPAGDDEQLRQEG
jgi:hypothetical protein